MGRKVRKTILLVEGDSDLAETLAEVLENAGFDVLRAATGREALDALVTRGSVSLILLDPRMPMLDRFDFRRRQASNPELACVPVVLLSGTSSEAMDGSPNFSHVLMKPFGQDALLELVTRYCGDPSGDP